MEVLVVESTFLHVSQEADEREMDIHLDRSIPISSAMYSSSAMSSFYTHFVGMLEICKELCGFFDPVWVLVGMIKKLEISSIALYCLLND
jgi:hypothetical protein